MSKANYSNSTPKREEQYCPKHFYHFSQKDVRKYSAYNSTAYQILYKIISTILSN